jgi:hypothetical protein
VNLVTKLCLVTRSSKLCFGLSHSLGHAKRSLAERIPKRELGNEKICGGKMPPLRRRAILLLELADALDATRVAAAFEFGAQPELDHAVDAALAE